MEPNQIPQTPDSQTSSGPDQAVEPGAAVQPGTVSTPPVFSQPAADRPMAVVSPAQPTITVGGPGVAAPADGKKRFSGLRRKRVLLPAAALLVLLGGSAGAYFGYYTPNKPENVWRTALTNTGKGYDKLSAYAESQFNGETKGVKINGSFKLSGSMAADGTFQGSSDGDNGQFSGSLSATGLKVNLDTRVIKSATGDTPDIYFKVDGIQDLGSLFGSSDPQLKAALNGLNGNWYFVDHTLFDQYAKGANSDLQFSQADIKAVLDAVGKSAKQYVFTNDQSKMAFVIKQQIGKEKQDGRNVYHYKVGINKNNLKALNNSLCDSLKDAKLFKAITGGQSLSSCKDTKDIDGIKDSDSADVWVDLHTKLIHKIRFTDKADKNSYFDIGQDYQGGDSFPFNVGFQSKSNGQTSHGTIKLILNTKTNTLSIDGSAMDDGDNGLSGTFNMTVSPNNSPVKVDKPANAKTIIQLLNDLGFGDTYSQAQSSAKDTERKTDINAILGHLEAYYAESGYYPSLTQLNNPAFRAANMQGLDTEAFKDPAGTGSTLSGAPAAHVYAYQPTPAGCDNIKIQCTGYTLTATLDTGPAYVKKDLNSDSSFPAGASVIQN